MEFIFNRNHFSWSLLLWLLFYFLFIAILSIFTKRDLLLYTLDDEGILHHQGNWKKIPWQEIKRAKRLGKNEGVFLELKTPKEFVPRKFQQRLLYFTISGKGIIIYLKFTEMSGKEILALIDHHLAKVGPVSESIGEATKE